MNTHELIEAAKTNWSPLAHLTTYKPELAAFLEKHKESCLYLKDDGGNAIFALRTHSHLCLFHADVYRLPPTFEEAEVMSSRLRIAWLDSCGVPSRIHLLDASGRDTICGGHDVYIANRQLFRSPKKYAGRSRFCSTCFRDGGKGSPWDPRCITKEGE